MVPLKLRVMGVLSREGIWSEVVLRNVTDESVGERGTRPAYQRGVHGDCLGGGLASTVGMAREGNSIMEVTGPGDQHDVGGKEGESREFPSFKEYLKI